MPRLNTPVAARPDYFDRNPLTVSASSATAGVEDTAATELEAYTVPTDRKAFVNIIYGRSLVRVAFTSSTVNDEITVRVGFTPNGQAEQFIESMMQSSSVVAQGDSENFDAASAVMMLAGDKLDIDFIIDGDAAGAGRVRLRVGFSIIEFDA